MKTMKTFWMDSNLAKVIKNLFPNQNQGEFIRKSVEDSMDKALKRIWHPIGYVAKSSGRVYGTYCFKYFYGFYPKLKRQFVFIKDIEGTSFINGFPESKDLLFKELSITPDEIVDILFIGINDTVSVSKDQGKKIWNVLALDNECLAHDISIEYKAFVEEYVNTIISNATNYSQIRYYGVRESLGFPVEYDFENYEVNHLLNLTGHLGIVNLPDEYKNPYMLKNSSAINADKVSSKNLDEHKDVELEDELFSCRSYFFTDGYSEPTLYFNFGFKKNGINIYPGYKGWKSFYNGISNTVVGVDGKLKSVDLDSVYTIIDNNLCIFRGMKFDMNIVADNLKLQEFILKYTNLAEYKKMIEDYESARNIWEKKHEHKR